MTLFKFQPVQGMSKLRNQQSVTGSDQSAVDMYEGNIGRENGNSKVNRRKQMKRESIPGFLDSSKSYQVIVTRVNYNPIHIPLCHYTINMISRLLLAILCRLYVHCNG